MDLLSSVIPILITLLLLFIMRFMVGKASRASWKHIFLWLLFGILSAIPIVLLETPIDVHMAKFLTPDTIPYGIVKGFLMAALIEESVKFVILLLCFWKRPVFRCTFDAVIAAAAISGGYGMVEGIFSGFQISFVLPIVHISLAVFMGIFFAKAKQAQLAGNASRKTLFLILSWLIPFLLHGLYDFLGMSGDVPHFFTILVLYNFILPFAAFIFVISAARRNVPLIQEQPAAQTP